MIKNICNKITNLFYDNKPTKKQELIDKITYDFYVNDTNNYFQDKLVPSVIYDIFMSTSKIISTDVNERCNANIKQYNKNIQSGNFDLDINQILKYYPIQASQKLDLLGEYIINTPLCMFLDKSENECELVIKLDGTSTNNDLNVFSQILKNPYEFKNIIIVYDYDSTKKINFLKIKNIYDVETNENIYPSDEKWLEYLQNGYLNLFMAMTLYHALWHLMTAYITCVAKKTIKNNELVEIFTFTEQNIFNKANEVKTFFLQSPLLFNTILYENTDFMNYASEWVFNFIENFDINTHYEKYILRNVLNPEQLWMPGFEKNLSIINAFSKSILSNTKSCYHETFIWKWNGYKNVNSYYRTINVSILIQILYTIGSAYHSYTFEYQKLGFTEILYSSVMPKNFYKILLSTLDWNDTFVLYGNYENLQHNKYLPQFKNFYNDLEHNRSIMTKIVESNDIYKSYIFTDICNNYDNYCFNTWNTRI